MPKAKSVSWCSTSGRWCACSFFGKGYENNWGPIVKDDPIFAEEHFMDKPCLWLLLTVISKPGSLSKNWISARNSDFNHSIEKESWVLPPVEFSHGEVHFTMQHIIFQVLLSWVGILSRRTNFLCDSPRKSELYCSTQHPTEMQLLICHALICIRWVWKAVVWVVVLVVAVGAVGMHCIFGSTKNRCKLRLDRDDDMSATGKRQLMSGLWPLMTVVLCKA